MQDGSLVSNSNGKVKLSLWPLRGHKGKEMYKSTDS